MLDSAGRVTLSEAYRHAYDNTLRASSRTLAGTQHPSFRYQMTGHGDLILAWLEARGDRRGWLFFPEGRSYLGFIFARAETPQRVERALRDAHARLEFVIERELTVGGGST